MKKITLLILTLLLSICFISCSNNENDTLPDGMALLDNPSTDFYFYYPSSWQADRNDGVVSAYVSDTDRSNISVSVMTASNEVNSVDTYLTLGDISYFDHMKSTFPDLELITDGEELTLGGVPARRYVFTASVAGDAYKFSQIIAYTNGYIYFMTYTSTVELFDSHIDEVTKTVEEFKFK